MANSSSHSKRKLFFTARIELSKQNKSKLIHTKAKEVPEQLQIWKQDSGL